MNSAVVAQPDRNADARLLCERKRWLDVVGLALDWQLENPGDARAFFYQGIALAAMGRLSEAETSYRRALQLDSKNFKAWTNLANLLFESMDRQAEGMECLIQALESDPANRIGWINLAKMNGRLGRYEQAQECAERALILDPQWVDAHLLRARAAQMLGKPEIVRAASEALAKLPPEKFQRTSA